MSRRLVPIVEGHAEQRSVPLLIRRLAEAQGAHGLEVHRPIRLARSKLIAGGEIERAVEFAARQAEGGGVIILLDADDDPPCVLGPRLFERARSARADLACGVVLAAKEYENWLIAAIESLRGARDIPDTASAPTSPESIRGAKEWIGNLMGRSYSEVTDQPALTARFDLDLARERAASFDKFCREIDPLVSRCR
jgi:hypothetical protein